MSNAAFRPYTRFGMSNVANTVHCAASWLKFMESAGFSPDHPDFNPDYPRSVAGDLRAAAAAIISGTYKVTA